MRRAWIAIAVAAAAGCLDPVGSLRLEEVEAYAPLPVYEEFWAATEACSGRSGDLSRIEWRKATAMYVEGKILLGQWVAPHRIIVLRGLEEDARVVRHEMLHDLLRGDPDHRSEAWARCTPEPT